MKKVIGIVLSLVFVALTCTVAIGAPKKVNIPKGLVKQAVKPVKNAHDFAQGKTKQLENKINAITTNSAIALTGDIKAKTDAIKAKEQSLITVKKQVSDVEKQINAMLDQARKNKVVLTTAQLGVLNPLVTSSENHWTKIYDLNKQIEKLKMDIRKTNINKNAQKVLDNYSKILDNTNTLVSEYTALLGDYNNLAAALKAIPGTTTGAAITLQ